MDATVRTTTRWAWLFCALVTLAGGAFAQSASREEAQTRFDRGRELFEEGDYSAALVEFRRANELWPTFRILYNIGQVCYQLQDYPCALQSFTRYLGDGGAEVPPARASEVQREIDKLRTRVARLMITTNVAGAELAVDDVPAGKTPLAAPLTVSAGRRRVSAQLKGYVPVTRTVEVAGMETARLGLELVPVGARGDAPVEAPSALAPPLVEPTVLGVKADAVDRVKGPPPSPWWWALPVGLAGAGVSLGIWAGRESQALAVHRTQFTTSASDLQAMSTNVKALAAVSDVLDGLAIVSAGVLLVLTLFPPPAPVQHALSFFGVGPGGFAAHGSL